MSDTRFSRLEDVILDPLFPDLDLALRRGKHVDSDELALYTFLVDAREHLEPLYRRYGCELVHKSDGYFYLLPTNEKLGRRHLRPVEMLVGQALALLYLDPRTVEQGGVVGRDEVLGQLATVLGTEDLVRALNPQKKRIDERVAEEGVRSKVADAIRKLAALGFVSMADDTRIRLRPALLRFAEPARLAEPPEVVLARLAAEGELVLVDALSEEDDELEEVVPRTPEPEEPEAEDAMPSLEEPSEPSGPEAMAPAHVEPQAPVEPELVESAHVEPLEPDRVEPAPPAEQAHVEPDHVEPVQVESVHVEPVEPVHVERVHVEAVESAHVEPAPIEPVEPAPVEPVEPAPIEPVEPAPLEAAPVEPEPSASPLETPPVESAHEVPTPFDSKPGKGPNAPKPPKAPKAPKAEKIPVERPSKPGTKAQSSSKETKGASTASEPSLSLFGTTAQLTPVQEPASAPEPASPAPEAPESAPGLLIFRAPEQEQEPLEDERGDSSAPPFEPGESPASRPPPEDPDAPELEPPPFEDDPLAGYDWPPPDEGDSGDGSGR